MKRINLKPGDRVHFIGIGGIGMSGLAYLLTESGHRVSGSDLKDSNLLKNLRKKGAKVFIGHHEANLEKDINLVVYSTCIKENNPEIKKAKKLGIPIIHRQTMLSYLLDKNKGIAITGAHGKGTTTAFLGSILIKASLDPTIIVGAEVDDFGGNARSGKGDFSVMEADESDGTFTQLKPYYGVITNIDKEHLEHYESIENIVKANKEFIDNVKDEGCLFVKYGDENINKLLKAYKKRYKTFGFSRKADIYAKDIRTEQFITTFRCVYDAKDLGLFKIILPGEHNALNALAAILVALEIGIAPSTIKEALSFYKGALRRFELKGEHRGIIVIEDYAHHPTEIKATLEVCKNWNRGRVISIFQPHRFSRTRLLADEFSHAFELADEVILTDIYSAHEDSKKEVSSGLIFDKIKKRGKKNMCLLPKEEIVKHVCSKAESGDTILVLGAGDIGEISDKILERLKKTVLTIS